jgi:hypothetical protein
MGLKTILQEKIERRNNEELEARQEYEKRKSICDAYNRVFSSDDGLLILSDLAVECGENDTCFAGERTSETAYLLGRRSIFISIKTKIEQEIGSYDNSKE